MHTPIYILIEESVFNLVSCQGFEDDKKVPVFLYVMGSKTYSFLQNLVSPNLTQDITFEQLVAILKSQFKPKLIIIAEQFHFHRHSQAMEQSIGEYLAELCYLSTHCSFGYYLEQALQDRLVCRIHNKNIQEVTSYRAVEIAVVSTSS